MNAKEDLVEKNARKLSREERFNDETEASASRRRRRTTRFSVASRAKNRIGLVDGFGRQNSSSVSSLTSTSSRRRKRSKTPREKKRSEMFFFCLIVLMTFFGKEVQGKYPVARFKNETVAILSPLKDGNTELYVNSHDVEFTGDVYIKSLNGKVSEKMKTLKEGNERAYEGVKVVAERNGIEKVCDVYGTRYQAYDLETEKYGECTCKEASHEYGNDVYLEYMGELCDYEAYKLKNQTWRMTTVNPGYKDNVNSQFGSGLAVSDRDNWEYAAIGAAKAKPGGSTQPAYGQVWVYAKTGCDESLSGTNEDGYVGCQTKTVSGRTCQAWSVDLPHVKRGDVDWDSEETLDGEGNHNYCRNPDDWSGGIWCYTTDPAQRWEECNALSTSEAEKLFVYQYLMTVDGDSADAEFGRSVAAYGGYLLVGAPEKLINNVKSGVVYVYRLESVSSTSVTLVATLIPPDPKAGQRFGTSLSFDGDTLLVGSPQGYSGSTQSGTVYVYAFVELNEGSGYWVEQETTIMSQNAVAGQLFGTSVSLHEGIAIIGSGSASVSGNNAGAVQSFAIERFGSTSSSIQWEYRGEILAPSRSTLTSTSFGAALSLNYYSAIICDPTAKKVHMFTRDERGATWVEESAETNGLQLAMDTMNHTCASVTTWDQGYAAIGSPFSYETQTEGIKDLFPVLVFKESSSNVPDDANEDAAVELDNTYNKKKKK